MTRSDGVSLYRTYSDQGIMLIRNDGVEYGEAVTLHPVWKAGIAYSAGYKAQHSGKLWRCRQAHTSQAGWEPENVPALLEEICEIHDGTKYDPIPYHGNMALVSGKYYSQDGVTYLCNRDTVNPVYNPLSELVGIYVEIVN